MGLNRSPPSTDGKTPATGTREKTKKHQPSKELLFGKTYMVSDDISVDEEGKCGDCLKSVDEKGIQCDHCDRWYHVKCQKISSSTFKAISMEGSDVPWLCNHCRENLTRMEKELQRLEKENQELRIENSKLMERMAKIEERVDAIKQEVRDEINMQMKDMIKEAMKDNLEAIETLNRQKIEENNQGEGNEPTNTIHMKDLIKESVNEVEENKRREKNLIIYNLKESQRDIGKDRERDDVKICSKLMRDGLHIRNVEFQKIIRLGKRRSEENAKPRPLLLQLSSVREKWNILKQIKKLRSCGEETLRAAILVPDLSKEERDRERKLREELKRLKNNGGTGWYISKGTLKRRNFEENNNEVNEREE